jgi:hypothetical protein
MKNHNLICGGKLEIKKAQPVNREIKNTIVVTVDHLKIVGEVNRTKCSLSTYH